MVFLNNSHTLHLFCPHINDYEIPHTGIPLIVGIMILILITSFGITISLIVRDNRRARKGHFDQQFILSFHVNVLKGCGLCYLAWSLWLIFALKRYTFWKGHAFIYKVTYCTMNGLSLFFEVFICSILFKCNPGRRTVRQSFWIGLSILVLYILTLLIPSATISHVIYPFQNIEHGSYFYFAGSWIWDIMFALWYTSLVVGYGFVRPRNNRAVVYWSYFLAPYYIARLFQFFIFSRWNLVAVCANDIGNLYYFSFFAFALYRSFSTDSLYWQTIIGGSTAHRNRIYNVKSFRQTLLPQHYGSWSQNADRQISFANRNKNTCIPANQIPFVKHLAQGCCGDVDLHNWMGEMVVVKKVRFDSFMEITEYLEDFNREARLHSNLENPHVVKFFGLFFDLPTLGIVMEHCCYGSLFDLLHFTPQNAEFWGKYSPLKIARDIAVGMQHLHKNSIVHRDLKTQNILISKKGIAKIADFGSAKKKNPLHDLSIQGTVPWMAPEILRGDCKEIGPKSDVYSFSIILWELCTQLEPILSKSPPMVDSPSGISCLPKSLTFPSSKMKQSQTSCTFDITESKGSPWVPFSSIGLFEARNFVADSGFRPPLPNNLPYRMKELIRACWVENALLRPEFSEIVNQLDQIIAESQMHPKLYQFPFKVRGFSSINYSDTFIKPNVFQQTIIGITG